MNLKLLKAKGLIKLLHQLILVFEFCEQVIPIDLFTSSNDMYTTNLVLSARKTFLYIPAIKTTTYGYRSMKFHCAKLWNDTFRKGIAIDGFGNNSGSLRQLHNTQKTLSLQLHFQITIYYIRRCTLFITLFINYLMPRFFPFPSPYLHSPTPPPPHPIFYLFIYFLLKKRKWSLWRFSYDPCMIFSPFPQIKLIVSHFQLL